MAQTHKKLSKKALKSAAFRHNWTLQWCWNYERMQASGFAYSMVPVMKELYDTDEEVCANLERHMQFYNTNPATSAIIMGSSVALEEDYQPDMSDSIKVALMGPLAGIGDTIGGSLVQPLAYVISASLAQSIPWPGNLFSLLVLIIPFAIWFWVRWPFFYWGYRQSSKIITDMAGASDFNLMRDAAQILGLTVMGGFVPSILAKLAFKFKWQGTIDGKAVGKAVDIQGILNSILPYMVPIGVTAICYGLLRKKMSPIAVLGIIAVVFFILGAIGWM
jgi:mannose/fructose/N-acetylgalactosamine-specific phosphotransferase system component IID